MFTIQSMPELEVRIKQISVHRTFSQEALPVSTKTSISTDLQHLGISSGNGKSQCDSRCTHTHVRKPDSCPYLASWSPQVRDFCLCFLHRKKPLRMQGFVPVQSRYISQLSKSFTDMPIKYFPIRLCSKTSNTCIFFDDTWSRTRLPFWADLFQHPGNWIQRLSFLSTQTSYAYGKITAISWQDDILGTIAVWILKYIKGLDLKISVLLQTRCPKLKNLTKIP